MLKVCSQTLSYLGVLEILLNIMRVAVDFC